MSLVRVFLIVACTLHAQRVPDEQTLRVMLPFFERVPEEKQVPCRVRKFNPRLNFSFEFQSGYYVYLRAKDFAAEKQRIAILVKVTPEGGKPAYLYSALELPNVPDTNAVFEAGGGFLVGEGKYHVDWILSDIDGRVCREQWEIEAKLGRRDRDLKLDIPPNTASDFMMRGVPRPDRDPGSLPERRITILLNAAPTNPRRTTLPWYDRTLLLSTLHSLIARLPAQHVRIVAFNLDQEKELVRVEDGSDKSFDQVRAALDKLELNTVNVDALSKSVGPGEVLAEIINRELRAEDPPDAVVVLGPTTRHYVRFPKSALEEGPHRTQFFFIAVKTFPDVIESAVKALEGEVLSVRRPVEFARAIEEIEDRLPP
jgi:hypothetical protein